MTLSLSIPFLINSLKTNNNPRYNPIETRRCQYKIKKKIKINLYLMEMCLILIYQIYLAIFGNDL